MVLAGCSGPFVFVCHECLLCSTAPHQGTAARRVGGEEMHCTFHAPYPPAGRRLVGCLGNWEGGWDTEACRQVLQQNVCAGMLWRVQQQLAGSCVVSVLVYASHGSVVQQGTPTRAPLHVVACAG